MSRPAIRWSLGIVVVLLAAAVLGAGGWAVITVVRTPDTVAVGEPVTVTYAVRQHGQQLLNGLNGRIEARFGGTVIQAAATALAEDGHYAATLTLPRAGTWTLDIVSGFNTSSGRAALRTVAPGANVAPLSPVERGGRLFVSKGCVTCHLEGVSAAPALRASGYEPGYLTQFLRRPPTGQKDEWKMPDLRLDEAEIASLVAFLNAGRSPDASATSTGHPADAALPACTVTHPNGQGTFLEDATQSSYGNPLISTGLWSGGTIVFKPGGPGFVTADGSLGMKWPWRRAVRGPLRIDGRRLDAEAPPLRAHIPIGYGETGFQSTALIFPTTGCWEVTGHAGAARLTFVTRVQKIGEGPRTRADF